MSDLDKPVKTCLAFYNPAIKSNRNMFLCRETGVRYCANEFYAAVGYNSDVDLEGSVFVATLTYGSTKAGGFAAKVSQTQEQADYCRANFKQPKLRA